MVELHSLICLKEGFLLLGLQTAGPLLTYIKNPYILGVTLHHIPRVFVESLS